MAKNNFAQRLPIVLLVLVAVAVLAAGAFRLHEQGQQPARPTLWLVGDPATAQALGDVARAAELGTLKARRGDIVVMATPVASIPPGTPLKDVIETMGTYVRNSAAKVRGQGAVFIHILTPPETPQGALVTPVLRSAMPQLALMGKWNYVDLSVVTDPAHRAQAIRDVIAQPLLP